MTKVTEHKVVSQEMMPLIENGIATHGAVKRNWVPARSKFLLISVVMGLIASGGIVGMYFQPPGLQLFFRATGLVPGAGSEQPIAMPVQLKESLAPQQNMTIKALGRLMPYGDVVIVAPPFGSGDARISKILVNEGQAVDAGDVIAELDNLDQLQSAVNIAEAGFGVAQATLNQTESLVDTSLKDLFAKREGTEESLRVASLNHQRIAELYQKALVPLKDFEQSELNLVTVKKSLEQVEAQLNRAVGGENQTDIQLALSQLKLARADVEHAKIDLQKAYVRAPKSGTVIRLHVRVGERPGNLGVATLGATDSMQAELEVYQTDIANVAPGANVLLTSPALKTPLKGKVSEIGLEVERQSIVGTSPAANLDARIIRVTVDLDETSSERAQRLTGLEVTATVDI